MKRYLWLAVVFTLCFTSFAFSVQEGTGSDYAYGIVASISSNRITIKEYSYLEETEKEVTYTIPEGVNLQGVASLTDVAVGDNVEIDYTVKNEQRVISNIIVAKETEESSEVPPEESGN